uniref:SHSP domain-containing protein n=1 Tax=Globodera rostochiensis TaxID=31243 RepID=A0A914GP17_GLORO
MNNNTQLQQQQQQQQRLRALDMDKWDINEKSDELAYRFDVSGFRPEQLTVELHGDEIVVKGEHKEQKEGLSVHNRFSRSVRLPDAIVRESIHCVLEDDNHNNNNASSARLCVCGKRQPTQEQQQQLKEEKHKVNTCTIPVKVVNDESKQQQQEEKQ